MAISLANAQDTVNSTSPFIEYTGRIDFSNPGTPEFSYSGVSIRACFTGTGIGVIMDDNVGQNFYQVILDGRLIDTLMVTTGKKSYTLASGLEDKTHEIELFKRTEEMFGKTRFFGFIVDEGESLTAITGIREELIEYVGNSITCGYGNEGVSGGTFGPSTENHYMTYAAMTSRNFNARHLAVSKSGIGIYRNYAGPSSGNEDCMTNYYTRIFLYDENPKYSFAEQPDLVCINLGTNDFSTPGGDSTLFVNNYFRLIDTIQSKYTMPDIICLLGPMLGDPALTQVRNYISFVADSANNKGKGNVYFFEMSQQTGSLGTGIDGHPTVAQHRKNGMELTEFIKSLKGWKVNPLLIYAAVTHTDRIRLEFNTSIVDSFNNYSGFKVFANDQEINISSVSRDTADNKILHIITGGELQPEVKVNISYIPGAIESTDTIVLDTVNYLAVDNKLTATLFTRGQTNSAGTEITLTCNKNLTVDSGIEGLIITNNKLGNMAIDSFRIKNTQLTLYIQDKVRSEDSVFAAYSGNSLSATDGVPLTAFDRLVLKNNSLEPASTEELEAALLTVYPNPNHMGIFMYHIDASVLKGNVSLSVYSTDGTMVYLSQHAEPAGRIDLGDHLSSGTYYVRIISEKVNLTVPVVISER